jgi:hypothetical protein
MGGIHEHGATFCGATDRLIRFVLTNLFRVVASNRPSSFVVVFLIRQPTGNKQTNTRQHFVVPPIARLYLTQPRVGCSPFRPCRK